MERLLIIDGHAYAYRAFHAIRELNSPSGQPTNAIYGFIKMAAKLRGTISPTHWIVVWDGGLSAERRAALPEYKAQRPEMPEPLRPQLDQIVEYLEAARIASFCSPGIEADDVIACLARRAEELDWTTVIASSDKDFMQLVSPRIGLLNPHDKTEVVWAAEQVRAKAGVEPAQIVDWLSLIGDNVDNIPGVPGIGPKTAADLLNQFGSVEELFKRLDQVKSARVQGALLAAKETVVRNRELVRLHKVSCDFSADEMAVKPPDTARLAALYERWGFKTLLAALKESASRDSQALLFKAA
ncbi:MAG TPA: 5'-3' exonuclease H3TH domain-containing protein [Candidatus Sulfotelmatobacter sp.]|nr:5'-3' exonuclease H3TH domain-containing protein [Candidatus Sulfotelmatobacter sp.]